MAQMFGAPVPFKSPADVRRDAQQLSVSILSSYQTLQAILARHEATIQQRWSRKKRHQRLDTLTRAWGHGMPTVHRPDFEAFRKESNRQVHNSTVARDCYVWPYINEEDLVKPKSLLLLLHARGHNHPSEFAGADFEAMHLGVITKKIIPVFLNEYVMILHGARNAKEYGKLLAWSEHPDAFDWMCSRKQFMPGEGLVVLEAQQRLLGFLVKCCEHILHDVPSTMLTTGAIPLELGHQLKSDNEKGGFASLTVMAAEAPYRPPARLDFNRIESLLRARLEVAKDHVWALREDPGYFAEQLAEAKEHRQEMLKDLNGDTHPSLAHPRQHVFWGRVIKSCIIAANLELEAYSQLHRQAKELQQLHTKYAQSLSPTEDLPGEFLGPILKFRHYLNQTAKGPMQELKQKVVASPPMRRFFVREPPVSITTSMIQVRSKSGVKMSKTESHLIWLLRTLWDDGQDLFFVGLPLLLDELERLLQAEPQAKELVSAQVARDIGNLSILSQCINQLEMYHPWARGFESMMVDREAGIRQEFTERTKPWARMLAALDEKNLHRVAELGNPSGNKFAYPSEKRRNKENTEALRQAESNLDDFWAAIDRLLYDGCGSLKGTALESVLSQQRSLQRTPEWVQQPDGATIETQQHRSTQAVVESIYKPLSTLYFELPGRHQGGSEQTPIPPKRKTKTKSATAEETPQGNTAGLRTIASDDATVPLIQVDARALKVFRALFFDPAVTSTPGEVQWKDFLYAMTSTVSRASPVWESSIRRSKAARQEVE
ncbi:hypothetical protein CH63R_14426 [Colletotrichum higginsianum IMI 349063]|uniref:Uncharacterized protein n=1 Tax=Colletotrichum higginsianum (strain IMI 349063) TaxID=759273 RepID=A0A1B7XQT5_COLHI|nr:hypothetical protein CH63R_14426 [Colletotrichum higginsianum IMI 349063]OBR02125.1 hypothetical protein CH63R_14426 [Colletotrichum higginsianum IMI 349063]